MKNVLSVSHVSPMSLAETAGVEADFEHTSSEHSEPDAMLPMEQEEDADWRYDRMQQLVESIWHSMFQEKCPDVVCFGSRDYGLATQSSDWDYALEIHERL